MRRILIGVFLLGACQNTSATGDLAVGLPDGGAGGCPLNLKPAATVTVTDDKYTPSSVTIPVCGRVRWNFMAGSQHGVYPWDMGFPASPVESMGTYEYVFPTKGTFDYGCAVHGRNMPGQVIVN
jgi:plastocyanin